MLQPESRSIAPDDAERLWSGSLVSQRRDWIHLARASRRQVRRREADDDDDRRLHAKRPPVMSVHVEEQLIDERRGPEGRDEADRKTHGRQRQATRDEPRAD